MENPMQTYNRENDEVVIDLAALFYHLLTKWRIYVIVGIIGILIGVGLTLLPESEPTLDDVNMKNVNENRMQVYENAHNHYAYQEEYMEKSELLKLDEYNTATGKLRYYITAPRIEIEMIASLYGDIMSHYAIWDQIREAGQLDCEDRFLRELASYGFSYSSATNSDTVTPETIMSATLSFSSIGATEEFCQAVLDILSAEAERLSQEIASTHENFTYAKIAEWTESGYNGGILDAKRNAKSSLSGHAGGILALDEEMSEDEELLWFIENPEEEEDEPKGLGAYAKNIIIVCFLLLFVFAGCHVVQFLLDSRIRKAEDVKTLLGLHLLAVVPGGSKKALKGIDAWLANTFQPKDHPATNKAFLLQALRVLPAKSLTLCADVADDDSRALTKWVSEQDAALAHAGFLHSDEKAQQLAVTTEGVVMVVKLGKTTKQQLQRDIEICRVLKLPLAGAVVID